MAYRKIRPLAKILDPPQQELELPVRGGRLVLRHHVPGEIDRAEGQAALGVPAAEIARAGESALVQFAVVGDVETEEEKGWGS